MRILFDQSAHDMRNKGNNALLETAMRRLNEFWPDASLEVLTIAPGLLKISFPNTSAINPDDLNLYRGKFDRYRHLLPLSLWQLLLEVREEIQHRGYWNSIKNQAPEVANENNYVRSSLSKPTVMQRKALQEAISQFDLFVASGGGYLTDSDKPMLWHVFNRLDAAIAQGVPTVMVGQGIGPLTDPELLDRAREILPSVGLILYRNRRIGLPLLESLGVLPEKMILTGDDAVEMTYNERSEKVGYGIGVSIRVAHYTGMMSYYFDAIRSALYSAANKYRVPLIAIPISASYQESDITHIKKLLGGYNQRLVNWRMFETPLNSIRRTRKCRVVVTGTYHGAIFALGQGIPVVGIASSDEYFSKLDELADEFTLGIRVLRLGDDHFSEQLETAIDEAWDSAEALKPPLLRASARQIEAARAGYQRICDWVEQELQHTVIRS